MTTETKPVTDAEIEDLERLWQQGGTRLDALPRLLYSLRASRAAERDLREALELADSAMAYMGDQLNDMDAVEPEDEVATEGAFAAVRIALGRPLAGDAEALERHRCARAPARRCTGHCHCHAGPDGFMHPPCCEDCAPAAPAPASPRPEEPSGKCAECVNWRGPQQCEAPRAFPGVNEHGDIVCSGYQPHARPEEPGGGLTFDDALRIARGCLDYGGGHRDDEEHLDIYHHGIQTVINSLEAASKRGLADTQVRALHRMGAEPPPRAQPEEPGRCVALDGMPGCSQPPVPGTRLCWAHGGDLVASPRAQPEAPRCGGCGYLPSFDSVEQGVYAPSGEPCPGCPDCAGRSSQPEVKP